MFVQQFFSHMHKSQNATSSDTLSTWTTHTVCNKKSFLKKIINVSFYFFNFFFTLCQEVVHVKQINIQKKTFLCRQAASCLLRFLGVIFGPKSPVSSLFSFWLSLTNTLMQTSGHRLKKSLLYLTRVVGDPRMTSPAGTLCSSIVTTAVHFSRISDNRVGPAL